MERLQNGGCPENSKGTRRADRCWRNAVFFWGMLAVFVPSPSLLADDATNLRQMLEMIGYEVVESVDSKAPAPKTSKQPAVPQKDPEKAPRPLVPDKPRVLLKSPENVMLHLTSTTIRITPPNARTPGVSDITCEAGFQWGITQVMMIDGELICHTYLILHDEEQKLVSSGGDQSLTMFTRGTPTGTSRSMGQTFPPSFRSGWGKFIVIGADSKSSPLRLLGYQRFRILPMKQTPISGVKKQVEAAPTAKAADVLP